MTVSSSTNVVILSADGSTHSFSFTFKIFAASDLKVIVRSAAGVETEKTLDSHYIIPTSSVGNTSGGNILFKFNTGTSSDAHYSTTDFRPANGEKVILRRQQPQTQELDLVDNDPFSATLIEEQFDKVVMQIQGVQEAVDRSLKFSRSNLLDSSGSQIGSTYPEIEEDTTARANKVLSFDSTGTPIATQEIGTLRGDWAADTAYQERDIVKDTSTSDHFIVNTAHTSSGSQPLTTNANSAKYTAITNFASSIITGTITASAINTTTSGTDNLIAGQDAGDSIQSGGQYNVLLGHDAGTAITTGDYNVAVGNEALKTETNTNMTVAVGHKALAAQLNTSSDNNVFNVAVGARAGEAVTTGSVNTLIGGVAGKSLLGGGNNVAIGYGALYNEQLSNFNTAVGHETLYSLQLTSSEASAVSFAANNTALGNRAGYSLDSGTYNTFLGVTAGYNITSGSKNTVVGGFDGNEGGLDIRTSSNYIVLSDGDGNPRLYMTDTGTAHFASTVTATGFTIGNAAINENDLEAIDDITAGIVSASKAAIVDTNKDITGFRNVTLTGELDAGSLDISGDADIAGTTNLDDTDIDGTLVVDGSNISLDSTSTLNIDNSNTSNGITIGTATSGVPVSIGHSTSEVTINDNLNVTGDLTVNGTTTTVNSTVTTVVDPILTIGSNSTDDNKDRGLEFKYNDGSARVGFFGYDDSASAFTVFTAATNSSEVFSGTTGNAIFNQVTGTLQTAAQTNITSVGALDGGSITSGFGNINNGSSTITTTGAITGGSLTADGITIDGQAITTMSGDLTIEAPHAASDIILDCGDVIILDADDNGQVFFKDGGTTYGSVISSSGELVIQSGSTPTTAVTFAGANATFAGTVASTGVLTANAGVVVDNITIDGTEIDLSSGDLTLDVAGILNLDAGTQVILKDDGANYGTFYQSSSDFYIQSLVQDKDIIFYGNDGGSGIEAMRIDMSEGGNVGIGTSSPEYSLHVEGSSVTSGGGLAVICATDTSTAYNGTNPGGGITFRGKYNNGGSITNFGTVQAIKENSTDGNYASALRFTTRANGGNLTERMRIDSSGVVNIGTTSGTQPSYFNSFLNVQNNASTGSHASITITSGSGGYAGLHFGDSDNGRIGQVAYNNSDNSLLFTANNSERMRIDSSGHVFVAKTSSALATVGVELINDGRIFGTTDGQQVLGLNRKSSNGDIITFYKDGSSKGTIGTNTYGEYNISSEANLTLTQKDSTDRNINFGTDHFGPFIGEGDAVDLGRSNAKWRDLYLSGGIQFDARSNKLDDYEEGIWTPTLVGGGSFSASQANAGTYTKIGRLVYLQCLMSISSYSQGSLTHPYISGLPFTPDGGNYVTTFGYANSYNTTHMFTVSDVTGAVLSGANFYLGRGGQSGTGNVFVQRDQIQNGSVNMALVYYT